MVSLIVVKLRDESGLSSSRLANYRFGFFVRVLLGGLTSKEKKQNSKISPTTNHVAFCGLEKVVMGSGWGDLR